MPTDGLFTVVTDELVMEIRLAAARCGGMEMLAARMGINSRAIRRVICQRTVSEAWVDRFCAQAPTALWITDFEWMPWGELMKRLDSEWKEVRGGGRVYE